MRATLADEAARLPWLPPSAASLVEIAKDGDRLDYPARVLLARHSGDRLTALKFARAHLDAVAGNPAYERLLADEAHGTSLGWLALSLIAPDAIEQLSPAELASTANAVTRRLARRWKPGSVGDGELVAWQSPASMPLLADLLDLAIKHLETDPSSLVAKLESEVDSLHDELAEARSGSGAALERAKLEAIAQFAAGAGHEINNPLAVISGQAQLLLQREEEPLRQQGLRVITQQAQRVHTLITDLMQFARPSRPNPVRLDAARLAEEVVEKLRPLADTKGVQLEVDIADGLPSVLADAKQSRTLLSAVVRNAIDAAATDGWAKVSVVADGDGVQFLVDDSGSGPCCESRPHLFDPFYSGRSAGRGRGLGLSTAWSLARLQGGSVEYAPQPDAPSRFAVRLVAAPAERMIA